MQNNVLQYDGLTKQFCEKKWDEIKDPLGNSIKQEKKEKSFYEESASNFFAH